MRILALIAAGLVPLSAAAGGLTEGLYRVEYRSEFPHLARHSIPRTAMLCLAGPPWPILGAVGAFADCEVSGMERTETATSYAIACPGVSGPRATAAYRTAPDRYSARIRVKLGAKNMTFDEIQEGEYEGPCGVPEKAGE